MQYFVLLFCWLLGLGGMSNIRMAMDAELKYLPASIASVLSADAYMRVWTFYNVATLIIIIIFVLPI